ncbi:hypothetical protein AHAS_Ahas14G0175700 [Arachis hypogaea]
MEKICVAVRLRPPVSEDSSNGASKRSKRIMFHFTGFMTHCSLTLFMLLVYSISSSSSSTYSRYFEVFTISI